MPNTEHIFNIAISVDEDSIKKKAEEYCANEITKALRDGYIQGGYYGKYTLGPKLEDLVEECCVNFFKENREEIVYAAAEVLAKKIQASKAFRDAMKTAYSEGIK